VFNTPERGHSNSVFEKQHFLHSQKLRSVVGQKYHPEWYFLTRPTRTIVIGCIDYLAYGTIFTRVMFCPKIKLDVFFPPEKPQMSGAPPTTTAPHKIFIMSDEEGKHCRCAAACRCRTDDTLPPPHCRQRQCCAAAKLPPLPPLLTFYLLLLSSFPSPLPLPHLVDC
jgi:hypothetical protein